VKSRDTTALRAKREAQCPQLLQHGQDILGSAGAAALPLDQNMCDPQRPIAAARIVKVDPRVLLHGHLPRDHPSEPHPQGIWVLFYQQIGPMSRVPTMFTA